MEYPVLMYRVPGPHFGPPGVTYDWRGARDESQMADMLADGWCHTLDEAINGKRDDADPVADDAPVTRAELEQKAREIGLQFHHRTGDKKLAEMIEAAMK